MGWWSIDGMEGGRVMGDGPADIMGAALEKIQKEYQEDWGRPATKTELRACFNFCASIYDDEGKRSF
jgi:hypothetical protein